MDPTLKRQHTHTSTLSKTILKVMALFSGLQMFGIICSILKMKLVALWLHADGVGMFGIFSSTIETASTLTDLGLRQSAVRDVAINRSSPQRLQKIIAILRKWCLFGGFAGAIILSALSLPLSIWLFDSPYYWWQFCIIGACMIFNSIVNGEQAIMQGTSMLRNLAKSTLATSIAGVAISIPLFYLLGNLSVILSIFTYAMAGMIATSYYGWKGAKIKVTTKETVREGKSFVKLGIYMSVSAFIANVANMTFLAWLSHESDTTEVGFYQAGVTIVIRYVGLIFTAIGVEFYPRLAANAFSPRRTSLFVNHEIKLILLVLTPVVILFLLFRTTIIQILYTPEFQPIIPFISWALLSSIFKGVSWCMAYVMLARADGKTYIITETIDAITGLLLCIVGYNYAGLTGVGLAYIGWYALYTLITGWIYTKKYKLRITSTSLALLAVSAIAITATIISLNSLSPYITYPIAIFIAFIFAFPIKKLFGKK